MDQKPVYNLVVLKVSGEALGGEGEKGISVPDVNFIAGEIADAYSLGVRIAIVIGGGNIVRGEELSFEGIDREVADKMGMAATTINALCLQDALEKKNIPVRVATALPMPDMGEYYVSRKVRSNLKKSEINILAAGTGLPFFTTDTAAVLRALELKADAILKATKVKGVYSKSPHEKGARILKRLTPQDMLRRGLRIMDSTAASLLLQSKIPVIVFKVFEKGNLRKVLLGDESIGSRVEYKSEK